MDPVNTVITVGGLYGKMKVPNITLEDAKFWGRPNFRGEPNRFGDSRKDLTVIIPNDLADQLRTLGYNVKTTLPKPEFLEQNPDAEPISSLRVMIDEMRYDENNSQRSGPEVHVRMGEQMERLNNSTVGIIDRARIENLDMEIRAWEYNPEEKPGEFSARLVKLVAVVRPNVMDSKYGMMP